MQTRSHNLGRHARNLLVAVPLALLAASAAFDLLHLIDDRRIYAWLSYVMIPVGLIASAIAAPWGVIDWFGRALSTRPRSVAAFQIGGMVVVFVLFAASWWLRHANAAETPRLAVILSSCGAGLALLIAWLGPELIDRFHVTRAAKKRGPMDD